MGSGILKNCWICFTVFPRIILKNYKCIKRIYDLTINFDLHYLPYRAHGTSLNTMTIKSMIAKIMPMEMTIGSNEKRRNFNLQFEHHAVWLISFAIKDSMGMVFIPLGSLMSQSLTDTDMSQTNLDDVENIIWKSSTENCDFKMACRNIWLCSELGNAQKVMLTRPYAMKKHCCELHTEIN